MRWRRYDPERIDQRDEERIERLASWLGPLLRRYHRAEIRGVENIPEGPALLVGNHNAGLYTPDTWLLADEILRRRGVESVPFGLGHQIVFQLPVLNQILVSLGGVRAGHDVACRLFEAGRKVLVYPGGDEDSLRPFSRRNEIVFGGRRGYIRLALRAGVPIVPVVAAGAHQALIVLSDLKRVAHLTGVDRRLRLKVWPITLAAPWGLTVTGPFLPYLPFPTRILIEVLPPIVFERTGTEAAEDEQYVFECASRVEGLMQRALTRLADERRAKRRG